MSEHTPTPWKLAGDPDNMIVCDEEGGSIADCVPPGPWMRVTTALENAAFIVKAVNAHEAMVAELRRLFELYGHQATADVLASVGKVQEP